MKIPISTSHLIMINAFSLLLLLLVLASGWHSFFAGKINNHSTEVVLEKMCSYKNCNQIKDFALNDADEQEYLVNSLQLLETKQLKLGPECTSTMNCSGYFWAKEKLMYLIIERQSNFAASVVFKNKIRQLDGEEAELYEANYVWPTLENFRNANDLIEVDWAKEQAKVFCYEVDNHHFFRHPKKIYENIKKNKVDKFTNEVEKIEGCLNKIKRYKM